MIHVLVTYIDGDEDEFMVNTVTPKANSVVCVGIDRVRGSGLVIPYINAFNIQWTPVVEVEEEEE